MYSDNNKLDIFKYEQKKFALFELLLNTDAFEGLEIINSLEEKHKYDKLLLLLSIMANDYKMNSLYNIQKHKEVYDNYHNILDNCLILIKELKLNSSLEICILYTYLLWKGYFSKNGEHTYNKQNIKNMEGLFGLEIMNGIGVCLNYSTMLSDLLNKTQYFSAVLPNYSKVKNKINYHNKIEINSKITFESISDFFSIINNFSGNHAFCLVSENEKMYIYDPTTISLINIHNKYEGHLLNGEGVFKIKPYYSYCMNFLNKPLTLLKKFHNGYNFQSPYTFESSSVIFDTVRETILKNENLFEDFKVSTRKDINNISNTLNKIKTKK